jgi:hypothetical protein
MLLLIADGKENCNHEVICLGGCWTWKDCELDFATIGAPCKALALKARELMGAAESPARRNLRAKFFPLYMSDMHIPYMFEGLSLAHVQPKPHSKSDMHCCPVFLHPKQIPGGAIASPIAMDAITISVMINILNIRSS